MVAKPEEEHPEPLLPAESLVEVPVFHSSNLTDFEKDYIEDSSNPLDVGEKNAAAADAKAAASAASKTVGKPGQEEAGTGSVVAAAGSQPCCEAMTAECLACKDGSSLEDYCVLHGDVKGCEKAFDCSAGLENWKLGWSDLKKMWCCTYKQKGCPTHPTRTVTSAANGTTETGDSWEKDYLSDGEIPDAPAASDKKSTVDKKKASGSGCVTRLDPRATAFGYVTATPGTPCVFGVDDRDEGAHCIIDDGKFGSFGWCWTTRTMDTWGSCSESCPLFGPSKVLERQIKVLSKKVADLATATTTTTTTSTTSTNATTTATTPVVQHKKPHKKHAATASNASSENVTRSGGKPVGGKNVTGAGNPPAENASVGNLPAANATDAGSQSASPSGPSRSGSAGVGPGRQAPSQNAGPGGQPSGGANAGPTGAPTQSPGSTVGADGTTAAPTQSPGSPGFPAGADGTTVAPTQSPQPAVGADGTTSAPTQSPQPAAGADSSTGNPSAGDQSTAQLQQRVGYGH